MLKYENFQDVAVLRKLYSELKARYTLLGVFSLDCDFDRCAVSIADMERNLLGDKRRSIDSCLRTLVYLEKCLFS